MRSYLFHNYIMVINLSGDSYKYYILLIITKLIEIGYYFIITDGNQFDGHWLYKNRGFCLSQSSIQYTINKVCRIKVTERDRLR